ncbi:hypothetical protein GIB67_030324 [Kingdonia uniflora]|uniref:Mitochondrial import inner membrane translocase subunit TIM14 n=1 Tax=Kingdonia uniflora TaxID=39325 RepID=A0A7J7M6M4_9MAGN|nr:hypothetical protein GIB67_030324 [Kingdonia uniflora]
MGFQRLAKMVPESLKLYRWIIGGRWSKGNESVNVIVGRWAVVIMTRELSCECHASKSAGRPGLNPINKALLACFVKLLEVFCKVCKRKCSSDKVATNVGALCSLFCNNELIRMRATPLLAGVAVATAAIAGRYGIQAWNAFKARPPTARMRKFYEGGFQPTMTRREAALILGVRESVATEKVREAHRRVMVANHPDAGGSHYLASKINEAKDMMLGKTKSSESAF